MSQLSTTYDNVVHFFCPSPPLYVERGERVHYPVHIQDHQAQFKVARVSVDAQCIAQDESGVIPSVSLGNTFSVHLDIQDEKLLKPHAFYSFKVGEDAEPVHLTAHLRSVHKASNPYDNDYSARVFWKNHAVVSIANPPQKRGVLPPDFKQYRSGSHPHSLNPFFYFIKPL